jgi:hypothetical protein
VPHATQGSKRKRRSKALPVLRAAGLSLSLASGAPGAPTADMLTRNTGVSHEITLREGEVSDVSLATFYAVNKGNAGTFRPRIRFAMGGGCGACGTAFYERRRAEAMLICRNVRSSPRTATRVRLSARTFRKTHKTHDCTIGTAT